MFPMYHIPFEALKLHCSLTGNDVSHFGQPTGTCISQPTLGSPLAPALMDMLAIDCRRIP